VADESSEATVLLTAAARDNLMALPRPELEAVASFLQTGLGKEPPSAVMEVPLANRSEELRIVRPLPDGPVVVYRPLRSDEVAAAKGGFVVISVLRGSEADTLGAVSEAAQRESWARSLLLTGLTSAIAARAGRPR